MSDVVMIVGCPASGKSSLAKELVDDGYLYLNRDTNGGSVISLLPLMIEEIERNPSCKIVLDNTFPTAESRKPFIKCAGNYGIMVSCIWLDTSIEEAQVNALNRMWDRYGMVFLDKEEIRATSVKSDPNVFPPAALFSYRKKFEKPDKSEGFSSINRRKFIRRPYEFNNKAIIFDYDGTLRKTKDGSKYKYPINPAEVEILPGVKEKLFELRSDGYIFLGVSNQSGVGKGILSEDDARKCFDWTNNLLGYDIDYCFCPHRIPPASCYCRKPQSGLGVYFIRQYELNPKQTIMVGDQTTDKTFASRLGFSFEHSDQFFKR